MARSRRTRSGARRRNDSQVPGWVWAAVGLIIGLAVAAAVWIKSNVRPAVENPITVEETAPPAVMPQPVPVKPQTTAPQTTAPQTAPAKPVTESPVAEPPKAAEKAAEPEEPALDFYKMLPQQTVEVPTDAYRKEDKSGPGPVLQTTTTTQPNTTVDSGSKRTVFLQAGSFRRAKDADRRRAELALIGVESRIERVQVNDGYWHRVRLGPYSSLDEANQIRARLHSENIQTLMVNAK